MYCKRHCSLGGTPRDAKPKIQNKILDSEIDVLAIIEPELVAFDILSGVLLALSL
jgi:hypothetical protein